MRSIMQPVDGVTIMTNGSSLTAMEQMVFLGLVG
jgi:hypothetical protein